MGSTEHLQPVDDITNQILDALFVRAESYSRDNGLRMLTAFMQRVGTNMFEVVLSNKHAWMLRLSPVSVSALGQEAVDERYPDLCVNFLEGDDSRGGPPDVGMILEVKFDGDEERYYRYMSSYANTAAGESIAEEVSMEPLSAEQQAYVDALRSELKPSSGSTSKDIRYRFQL